MLSCLIFFVIFLILMCVSGESECVSVFLSVIAWMPVLSLLDLSGPCKKKKKTTTKSAMNENIKSLPQSLQMTHGGMVTNN